MSDNDSKECDNRGEGVEGEGAIPKSRSLSPLVTSPSFDMHLSYIPVHLHRR